MTGRISEYESRYCKRSIHQADTISGHLCSDPDPPTAAHSDKLFGGI